MDQSNILARAQAPTAPLAAASPAQRWLEMALLYGLGPIAVYGAVHGLGLPLYGVLAVVGLVVAGLLARDRTFPWRTMLTTWISNNELINIIALFFLLGPLLIAIAYFIAGDWFFRFPLEQPMRWLIVMLLFPVMSVLAQELMFRVVFFRRYASLFGQSLPVLIVINALLFAWSHIIFQNWPAVLISFAGSLLFTWRYHRTRSFWAVVLEHTLYGNLLFTIGMGRYFYTGAAAVTG
jgi:uncharacterized protein